MAHNRRFPSTLDLPVSPANIAAGTPGKPKECPAAQALHQAGYRDFRVYGKTVAFLPRGEQYLIPPGARAWIQRYDFGEKVEPTTFVLVRYEVAAVTRTCPTCGSHPGNPCTTLDDPSLRPRLAHQTRQQALDAPQPNWWRS